MNYKDGDTITYRDIPFEYHEWLTFDGKQIDMSSDILQQMKGEVTKEDVEKRITFYKQTNESK